MPPDLAPGQIHVKSCMGSIQESTSLMARRREVVAIAAAQSTVAQELFSPGTCRVLC